MAIQKFTLVGYLIVGLLVCGGGYALHVNQHPTLAMRRQIFWEGVKRISEACGHVEGPERDRELAYLLKKYYPEVQEAKCTPHGEHAPAVSL